MFLVVVKMGNILLKVALLWPSLNNKGMKTYIGSYSYHRPWQQRPGLYILCTSQPINSSMLFRFPYILFLIRLYICLYKVNAGFLHHTNPTHAIFEQFTSTVTFQNMYLQFHTGCYLLIFGAHLNRLEHTACLRCAARTSLQPQVECRFSAWSLIFTCDVSVRKAVLCECWFEKLWLP